MVFWLGLADAHSREPGNAGALTDLEASISEVSEQLGRIIDVLEAPHNHEADGATEEADRKKAEAREKLEREKRRSARSRALLQPVLEALRTIATRISNLAGAQQSADTVDQQLERLAGDISKIQNALAQANHQHAAQPRSCETKGWGLGSLRTECEAGAASATPPAR
jgi:DNA repair exonuclease SbcCD ATPase subunit